MLRHHQTKDAFFPAMVFSTLLHGGIVLLLSLGSKVQQVYSIGNQQVMHAVMIEPTAVQAVNHAPIMKHKLMEHKLLQPTKSNTVTSAPLKKQPTQITQQPIIEEPIKEKSVVVSSQKNSKLKVKQPSDTVAATQNVVHRTVEKGDQVQKRPTNNSPSKLDKERLEPKQQSHSVHAKNQGSKTLASKEQGMPTVGEINDYATHIKAAIERNLIKESRYQGQQCEVALRIAEDGVILYAKARQGDDMVCGAAIRAIGITGRVPKPPNTKLYQLFKDLVISFEL